MIHTRVAENLWGTELIDAILRHSELRNFKSRKIKMNWFDFKAAKTIRALRKLKGLKQGVMADALDMTQSNYSKIEDGLRPLTIGQFAIIAQVLNTSISEILAFSADKKELSGHSISGNSRIYQSSG